MIHTRDTPEGVSLLYAILRMEVQGERILRREKRLAQDDREVEKACASECHSERRAEPGVEESAPYHEENGFFDFPFGVAQDDSVLAARREKVGNFYRRC